MGRVNVGKSTLFNKLSSTVKSLTLDYEGVTRDFIRDHIVWKDKNFDLVDCGGIFLRKTTDKFLIMVRDQVLQLIDNSSVIIFVVDGAVGVTNDDIEISKLLHKQGKPVILAINKIDVSDAQTNKYEFEKFGFKYNVGISAEHGLNLNELLDITVDLLPKNTKKSLEQEESKSSIVFLGKPNVGKSSLLNAILGEERAFTSDIPGTTREALSENITFYKETIQITDTPGIRKKSKVNETIETLMVKSAFNALKDSNIVLLLLDGSEKTIVDQELKLAFYAFEEQHKGLILLINKADLIDSAVKQLLTDSLEPYKHLVKKIPMLYISCKSGLNVGKVVPLIQKVSQRLDFKFNAQELEHLLISGLLSKPLLHKREKLEIYSVTQKSGKGIVILLEVNEPLWFGPSQLAFFEGLIRKKYDLIGVPIKFLLKKSKYHKRS